MLRDSALIAYALFLLVGYHLFRSWLSIKRVAVWFLLGTSLSALNGLAWFVVAPEQRRFIAPGIYILISLVATVLAIVNRRLRPRAGWVFVGLLCFGLMLANARSLFVNAIVMSNWARAYTGMANLGPFSARRGPLLASPHVAENRSHAIIRPTPPLPLRADGDAVAERSRFYATLHRRAGFGSPPVWRGPKLAISSCSLERSLEAL